MLPNQGGHGMLNSGQSMPGQFQNNPAMMAQQGNYHQPIGNTAPGIGGNRPIMMNSRQVGITSGGGNPAGGPIAMNPGNPGNVMVQPGRMDYQNMTVEQRQKLASQDPQMMRNRFTAYSNQQPQPGFMAGGGGVAPNQGRMRMPMDQSGTMGGAGVGMVGPHVGIIRQNQPGSGQLLAMLQGDNTVMRGMNQSAQMDSMSAQQVSSMYGGTMPPSSLQSVQSPGMMSAGGGMQMATSMPMQIMTAAPPAQSTMGGPPNNMGGVYNSITGSAGGGNSGGMNNLGDGGAANSQMIITQSGHLIPSVSVGAGGGAVGGTVAPQQQSGISMGGVGHPGQQTMGYGGPHSAGGMIEAGGGIPGGMVGGNYVPGGGGVPQQQPPLSAAGIYGAQSPASSVHSSGGMPPSLASSGGTSQVPQGTGPSPLYPHIMSVPSAQSNKEASPAPPSSVPEPDEAYKNEVEELKVYLEPLKKLLEGKDDNSKSSAGNNPNHRRDKIASMINVLEGKRVIPFEALRKCREFLMLLEKPEPDQPVGHPLLDAVAKCLQRPGGPESLKRSSVWAWGDSISPEKKIRVPTQADLDALEASEAKQNAVNNEDGSKKSSPSSKVSKKPGPKVPLALQREIVLLGSRFRINKDRMVHLPGGQDSQKGGDTDKKSDTVSKDSHLDDVNLVGSSLNIICELADKSLPAVPALRLKIPPDYPARSPSCDISLLDYDANGFLKVVKRVLVSKYAKLGASYTLSALMDSWVSSVQQANLQTQSCTPA